MPGTFLCHERMAVVNPDNGRVVNGVKQPTGEQPMWSHTRRYSWIHNGEIYNHQALEEKYDIQAPSGSDSEVIGFLYEKLGPAFVKELDGMYAFVVVDREEGTTFAARDHMGIIPMYMARGKDGSVYFGSEMKIFAGDDQIESYEEFPPGYQFTRLADGTEKMERWYEPRWITDRDYVPTEEVDYTKVREAFIDAVVSHMMVDVNHGVLLSGGLDSSLVTAVAVKHGMKASNRKWHNEKLHSFSVGIEGAPDLLAARKVAEFLGTDHHEFTFTAQEALDALPDVVYHIESFEQVRASVPMFLLSRKIKGFGVKMVLSGEGADEMFGGYLYFHEAPNAEEFHRECVRKTERLHKWDVLRANKSTAAWGVEARVPFLSQGFIDVAMNIRPEDKMIDMKERPDGVHPKSEKYILRKAFDTPDDPYLPEEVLWRQKEQFSDGVGYDWVDGLRDHAEAAVSDEMFEARAERFPDNTPATKEYYLLRSLFEEHFPEKCAVEQIPSGKSIACSTPEAVAWKEEWMNSVGDISGRAVNVHDSSDGFSVDGEVVAEMPSASVVATAAGVSARRRASVRVARGGMGGASTAPRRRRTHARATGALSMSAASFARAALL